MCHKFRSALQDRDFREPIRFIEVDTSRSNAEIFATALRPC
jgi:hypothetical protein